LRFLVAAVCQSVNPAAFLLGDELARWRAGRETVCDEAAVHRGADPCSLAEALIAVARPPEARGRAAHLSRGGGIELLRVRVTLLMDYATAPPRCHCARTAPKVAALAVVVLALLPHYFGQRVIVDLHQGAERVAFDALEMR
jgi:beta-lactamase regulating signal transducer with metallopeptidase domain